MKLRLISFSLCPFVHRATIMLREKGVAYETTYIDLKNKPEWFLKISPRGKVPVLVADDTTIFESAVIMEFLDETHGPQMVPADPFERARQRAWIEPANDLFSAFFDAYTSATAEEMEEAMGEIRELAARFEEVVKGPFFAGEKLGIVDVAIAPVFYRVKMIEAKSKVRFFPGAAKVDAWAQRLATRASVIEGVLPDFESAMFESIRKRDGHLARQLA